jgi:hypothetical protein
MNAMIPSAMIERELEILHQRLHEASAEESADDGGAEYRVWLGARRGFFLLKLAEYLGLRDMAVDDNLAWRQEVFRGQRSPDVQKNADQRRLFVTLLRVGEALQERAEYFSRHALPLDGERRNALDRCVENIRRELADWKPPVLSLSPALRMQQYSPEGAAKLQEILSQKDS